jgi:hypothetical protein
VGKLQILTLTAVIWFCTDAQLHPDKRTADANAIVQQSTRVTEEDQKASSSYDYFETDLQHDDSHKTFKVQMIEGSPYEELVAVDGKPLSKEKQAEERRKLQQETSKREHQSKEERDHRITKYQKELSRDRRFIDEIAQAFNFKMVGEQQLNNRHVYVVDARPRPDFHPTDKESAVLTGMKGRLWIDKSTYHWVKVEAEVIYTVSIEGFLAKVEPGTRFELEKTAVEENVWLPKHFSMTTKTKVLSLIAHHERQDEAYFNYHKARPSLSGDRRDATSGNLDSAD